MLNPENIRGIIIKSVDCFLEAVKEKKKSNINSSHFMPNYHSAQ